MDLSPRMNITTDATVQSQDSQEPAFRRLRRSVEDGHIATPVSYTHLTLPTSDLV